MADMGTPIQDAVIAKSNVGCHVAATKNRTSRTHVHGDVSPNIGMDDETPIGNAKRLEALHNGSPRAWVIDGDQELSSAMFRCCIDRAEHWPTLGCLSRGTIIQKAQERALAVGQDPSESGLTAMATRTNDDQGFGHAGKF